MADIFVKLEGQQNVLSVNIPSNSSHSEVVTLIRKVSSISAPRTILKLYHPSGALIPIGPNIESNSADSPYKLVSLPAQNIKIRTMESVTQSIQSFKTILNSIDDIKQSVISVKFKVEQIEKYTAGNYKDRQSAKPASRRVNRALQHLVSPLPVVSSVAKVVYEQLKTPAFDVWQFSEAELIHLMKSMFSEFNLIKTFQIDETVLDRFLNIVRTTYNQNPFHNFLHCFCVTQMMYALLHVTSVHQKLTPSEKLSLLVAAIGHDLDHPGFNNAYQVNASTELAITYNDTSPLENHHAAVLFYILKLPDTNILANVTPNDWKEVRKNIITCILATDMAKHGEIMSKFKSFTENFSYEDPNHRQTLFQMLIKCSDISNEVRPKQVSEPWVDNLLEEFFAQSDTEKAEGLPFAPFMDREKVTKPSAQVGFIGFVMIPLYELAGKVLPNLDEPVIQPIRKALEYYKSMIETK